jgi:hypothetical protein
MKPFDLEHEKAIGANCKVCGALIDFGMPGEPRTCADAGPPLDRRSVMERNCPALVGYVPAEKRAPTQKGETHGA